MPSVPAIEPAVERAKSRPAVRPSVPSERARIRIAMGLTAARMTLGTPKSATDATSGLRRGPGSQATTASSSGSSRSGIASTASPPSSEHADEAARRRGPVGQSSSRPVADGEPGEHDADQRAPDKQRVAEERRHHAARRDLDAEEHRARHEHGHADDPAAGRAARRRRGAEAALGRGRAAVAAGADRRGASACFRLRERSSEGRGFAEYERTGDGRKRVLGGRVDSCRCRRR